MEGEKKYRAYLTRRSKWEAIRSCVESEQVGVLWLRAQMVRTGERESDLDGGWEKRIFGDTKLFCDAGDGFFKLTDDTELGKKPVWKGERPWQDFVSDAYRWIMESVPDIDAETVSVSRILLTGKWTEVASVIVRALDGLRRKGQDEPLRRVFEKAWGEAMKTTVEESASAHAVALWLTVTRGDVCAYTRLRTYIKDGGTRPVDVLGPVDGNGSPIYSTVVARYRKNDDGDHEQVIPDPSPKGVLGMIRGRLVVRGIMKASA